ncbi:MAG: hypothetical protein GX808_07880, partial [Syntrophomonadaceae bacterium]|nr:hypothetical protein [Syntrophomonadaceae bacterium]
IAIANYLKKNQGTDIVISGDENIIQGNKDGELLNSGNNNILLNKS